MSSLPPNPPPPPPKPTSRTNTPPVTAEELQPLPSTPFVPELLHGKSRDDLQYLLHSPALLSSLYTATHPSSASNSAALTASLSTNIALSQQLVALETSLGTLRESTQQKLLETKGLEKRWREKEKEMYQSLQPFSEVGLHARLQSAVAEGERECDALAEEFLSGAGELEVEPWVRAYRDGRKTVALRRERRGRWDEGRVSGSGGNGY
ncbi:hypothetical protein FN846DRAFT_993574 [Sphaerosporella brunnea]|uniref:VPS37 C-terminal domain-containing protein n=1 Tax=Sphaerosporella brunnea TaxID=1250544 RepID=A0A5J5EP18_9PEZI|nr:hypothetical protein FN846DRAFT_993574 [Sphaerosporella brunnea]